MPYSDNFYKQIPGFADFTQFTQLKWYSPLPSDWFVVITDVEGSTRAIQEGLYKEVNSLGAASIVALLNAVAPLKVPYVFGGDGATVCIPPSSKQAVEAALVAARQLARDSFKLHLRIGMVPMRTILNAGYQVLIGKYQPSNHFQQAMFQGGGLGHAEALVKAPENDNPFLISENQIEASGSFEGFECRWNEIPSPHEETVAILVQALGTHVTEKEAVYCKVSKNILDIYGDEKTHHPVRPDQLTLTTSPGKLSVEARVRSAFQTVMQRWIYTFRLIFLVYAGKYLMHKRIKTGDTDWGEYKQNLIANTDYRKFDEVLRMVLSGTVAQRHRLKACLEQLYAERKVVFGIHASPNALVTCLVSNYNTDHIHFLDGSNGGYALAARDMKQQLKALDQDCPRH